MHPVHGGRAADLWAAWWLEDYEDVVAKDARIDALRAKIFCVEDAAFTEDYHDPEKRSIANALTAELTDGTYLPEVVVEYPIGHRLRRGDGIPLLMAKFEDNLARRFDAAMSKAILKASAGQGELEAMAVEEYVSLYVV